VLVRPDSFRDARDLFAAAGPAGVLRAQPN
jgi:hypothetical protein